MTSLSLTVFDERADRPVGNPFLVRALWEEPLGQGGLEEVRTGLSVKLGQDLEFSITSLLRDVYVLSYRIDLNGELVILVFSPNGKMGKPEAEHPQFASVSIVKMHMETVRFMEVRCGKRVIVGAPKEVRDG